MEGPVPAKLARAWRWILPVALLLAVHWQGLLSWFQKDDFAWLGLNDLIPGEGLFHVLFHPYAQGTVRTLSERVVYTSLRGLFGIHALPFRILAFVTFAAAVTLLQLVVTRLTGSRNAGFWAALLWVVNSNMAIALGWAAVYYELLSPVVFLSGIWLLVRYAESGERRYWRGLWVVYLAGFGVLELNVVFPALALLYCLCAARHLAWKTLPLFVPALLYTAAHTLAAPLAKSGPYQLHWDLQIAQTLVTYWKYALGPVKLIFLGIHPSMGRSLLVAAMTAGLLCYLIEAAMRRQWMPLFFAGWFIGVLSPLLPLRNHIDESYLTAPLAGLAAWAAMAAVGAWRRGGAMRWFGAALVAAYIVVNLPLAFVSGRSLYATSLRVERLVKGVVAERRAHPEAAVVITNLDPDLYMAAIIDRPFRLYGVDEVYVDPATRAAVEARYPGHGSDPYFGKPASAVTYDASR